jgi:hypothetical protein
MMPVSYLQVRRLVVLRQRYLPERLEMNDGLSGVLQFFGVKKWCECSVDRSTASTICFQVMVMVEVCPDRSNLLPGWIVLCVVWW